MTDPRDRIIDELLEACRQALRQVQATLADPQLELRLARAIADAEREQHQRPVR